MRKRFIRYEQASICHTTLFSSQLLLYGIILLVLGQFIENLLAFLKISEISSIKTFRFKKIYFEAKKINIEGEKKFEVKQKILRKATKVWGKLKYLRLQRMQQLAFTRLSLLELEYRLRLALSFSFFIWHVWKIVHACFGKACWKQHRQKKLLSLLLEVQKNQRSCKIKSHMVLVL